MRRGIYVACALCLAGCDASEAANSKAVAATSATPAHAAATRFCKLIYEAPLRDYQSKCGDGYPNEVDVPRLASAPVEPCVAVIAPGLVVGRLELDWEQANACARHLTELGWADALWDRSLQIHKPCRALARGEQAEGKACRLSLECRARLWCSGATFDQDGTCQAGNVVNSSCDAPAAWLFAEEHAVCGTEYHCSYGSFLPGYRRSLGLRRNRAARGEPGIGVRPVSSFRAAGSVPKEAVERAIKIRLPELRRCYGAGLKTQPQLDDTLYLNLLVDPQGRPGKRSRYSLASGKSRTIGQELHLCLTEEVSALRFPFPSGGWAHVTYELRIAPGDAGPDTVEQVLPPRAASPSFRTLTCKPNSPGGSPCVANHACGSDMICRSGLCRSFGELGEDCLGDLECASGLSCDHRPGAEKGTPGVCAHRASYRVTCVPPRPDGDEDTGFE